MDVAPPRFVVGEGNEYLQVQLVFASVDHWQRGGLTLPRTRAKLPP